MSLTGLLRRRLGETGPVRVGLIGAGKFATMFLSQVPHVDGIEVLAIADLDTDRAHAACREAGWPEQAIREVDLTDDGLAVAWHDGIDVVVEATGDALAGLAHAEAAIAAGTHVVMVNVEADVLAGPLLAARAAEADVVYSMAYGDQPAIAAELVDWARACGFRVAAAGKGTRYLRAYHASTPETVWQHYGITPERAEAAGMNAKMFNSFVDGTKSAIEMAALANATGLAVPDNGLAFPPCGALDLAEVLKPLPDGGVLARTGQVEVVSSLARDGTPVENDLRWGIYVTFTADSAYAAACLRDYGLATDASGRYAALWRPWHLIGLELNVSILNAALRGEATGAPRGWRGDAVATAKRDLAAGETLDGEGGATVWGRLVPAQRTLAEGLLPIGLSNGVVLKRPVREGEMVGLGDVDLDESLPALALRREMERRFAPASES